MDIVSGLAAIQSAMACAKGISSAIKTIKETDQKIALLDIREQLIEMEERLLDARDQTNELISQNQELRLQLTLKEEMRLQEDGNILWRIEDGVKKGPYCSTCYGSEGKLISLSGNDPGTWHCPKCKNHFHTKQWSEVQKRQYDQLSRQPRY